MTVLCPAPTLTLLVNRMKVVKKNVLSFYFRWDSFLSFVKKPILEKVDFDFNLLKYSVAYRISCSDALKLFEKAYKHRDQDYLSGIKYSKRGVELLKTCLYRVRPAKAITEAQTSSL